jgi:hypothetical protein
VTGKQISNNPTKTTLMKKKDAHSWPTKALPVSRSDWLSLELLLGLLLLMRRTLLRFASVGVRGGKSEFTARSLTALTE